MFGSRFDTLYVGSMGFAQLGQLDYHERLAVEKQVISDIIQENKCLQVPPQLVGRARYKWTRNCHDFGTYQDLEISYETDLEDDDQLSDVLWDWYNDVESFDFEKEEYLARCRDKYNPLMNPIHNDEDPTMLRKVE